jgi:hypothetical protein
MERAGLAGAGDEDAAGGVAPAGRRVAVAVEGSDAAAEFGEAGDGRRTRSANAPAKMPRAHTARIAAPFFTWKPGSAYGR